MKVVLPLAERSKPMSDRYGDAVFWFISVQMINTLLRSPIMQIYLFV